MIYPKRNFLIILGFLSSLYVSSANELVLVEPGKPAPAIILSGSAEDQERYAVEDLQIYLKRVSGVEAPILTAPEPGRPSIVIGSASGNESLATVVEKEKLGRDGFVIDVSPEAIRIVGGSKFGTAYGIYELLERTGVRWLFPGEWGEVVPQKEVIRFPIGQTTDRPAFPIRQMHIAHSGAEVGTWIRRNRHNRSGYGGHSGLVSAKRYGSAHPEWFAEVDGVRQSSEINFKLCHSNPEVTKQAITEVLDIIRERKSNTEVKVHNGYRHLSGDYTQISVSPRDGGGFCQCAECLKIGTISDRLQIFANAISDAVAKEYPEYAVGYYGAYSEAQMPPTVKANPGVIVYATTWTRSFFNPITDFSNNLFRQKIEAFSQECPRMAIRDFDGLSKWWGYGPLSLAKIHATDYQWYHQHGVEGVVTEAEIGWAPWGYSYYLFGKLLWNPFANLDELRRDFVNTGYAEASEPMWNYYTMLDEARSYPAPSVMHAMREELEKAARVVVRPDARRRIDFLRAHCFMTDILERKEAKLASEEEIATALRVLASLDPSASPLKDLRFLEKGAEKKVIEPLTGDELHAVLNTVVLNPPTSEFKPWSSGDDLRLIPLQRESGDIDSDLGINFRFGPSTILIHANVGEALKVWQKGKAVTSYQLLGPEYTVIDEGTATGDGAVIVDRVAPSEGIYTLTISSGGSRPRVHVSNRLAVVKASAATQRLHPFGEMTQFFYVPKGTMEFSITAKAAEPFTMEVLGPPGPTQIVYPKTTQFSKQFVEHRIEVPKGSDGGVWKIMMKGAKKEIYFSGIPPFLAADPSRLLIPGEEARPQ